MQTMNSDSQDGDEQSSRQEAYEWWWNERLSAFLDHADTIAKTCLDHVFDDSIVREETHVDVLVDIDDIDGYHEELTPRRFIEEENGTYDLDWEVETTDGIVSDVYVTCHAEYRDVDREVMTEIDVAIVAIVDADGTELVTQPHVVHRPIGA